MSELSQNALEICKKRYFINDDETWEDLSKRVAVAVSINEKDKKWTDIFTEEINEMNFIPGGRILRNCGKLKQSILNCACIPIGDSIEAIGDTIKNSLILWSYGAGIGIDFSPLRPIGTPLLSKGGYSSGMVSFIKAIDAVAHTIETGGQRRSGCLALCRISHPEIFEFIDAKIKDKELSYFNLSVGVDKNFIYAVEEDKDWDLTFTGKTYKTVKARDLWDKILESMIDTAEPGIINLDNLKKNNSYYFQPISSTNLCGEIPLPSFGTCCLGSLVLPNFLSGKQTNWKKLKNSINIAVRFLDNVLDVNYYPIKQMETITLEGRRIGLGVMGLHNFFIKKEIKYGSEKSIVEVERLFKFIRDTAYIASVELSKEKGAFPKYSRSDFNRASFVKKLPAKIRLAIKSNGIRNVCLTSAQPTGTSSLIPEVSSGIEPIFALAYKRKDRVSERYYIQEDLLDILKNNEEIPEWLTDSSNLRPEHHLEIQAVVQKYLDNAVSKTVNCPKGITKNELSELLLEFIKDLKGMTVYVDGTREGQVMERIPIEEAKKYVKESTKDMSEDDVQCNRGTCEI
ncbi:MAG: adenosylcobalamin-dependent ribonucleoside-diphosphate reductase [Nanoarchaeota archaeon]|nr:adenosylcobalamin-dependent ribonucleoside-diphosphate reductase [Nanoarchaeota archaeon]